ncbi:MAG: hypothetical protein ACF8Q5_03285 [Phycisphaerales bacterium JB040]
MLQSRTLIVVVSQTELEGHLVSGSGVVRRAVVEIDGAGDADSGRIDFVTLDQALAQVAQQAGAGAGTRTLVMINPGVGSCQVRIAPRGDFAAQRAGELAALHSCTTEDASALEARTWACDAGGSRSERALVSGAVRDSDLSDISDWVDRAGLRLGGVIPVKMWECRLALRDALEAESGEMICRISSDCTVLVVRHPGKADVVRVIDFGIRSIARVYARAATQRQVRLSQHELWSKVMTHGVSWGGKDSDDRVVRDALPLLAPVIQRINIELKQTLRYRVAEGTRVSRIRFSGLGRRVPGLCASISGHLELEHDARSDGPKPVETADGSGVRRHDFGRDAIAILRGVTPFLPRALERRRAIRRLSAITAQGAMIALAMVAGEWAAGTVALRDETGASTALLEEVSHLRESVDSDAKLRRERAEVLDHVLALDEALDHAPHWPAAARAVLDCDPLRVENITISHSGEATTAVFTGWLPAASGERALEEILDRWHRSGPVRHAEPTSIVRTLGPEGQEVLRLRIDFTFERFPVWVRRPELATVFDGGPPS